MRQIWNTVGVLSLVMGNWASGAIAQPEPALNLANGNLTVEISGFANQEGKLCVNLFASSRGFPSTREQAVQRQCTAITEVPMVIKFSDLQSGNYAVSAYHDANSDETLNRNSLGMPIEGYGFSQNPEAVTGPPEFNEAAVLVAGSETDTQIQLRYADR